MNPRSRWISLALALCAASAFAIAVQSAWWSAGEVAIGPFGSRHCFGGECRESGLSWLGGTDLWMRSGVAARAGGYIAMFVFVVLAGGIAARRAPLLVARASLVAIVTAAVTGGYFVGAFPGLGGASLGLGAPLFGLGLVVGIGAAITVLRSGAASGRAA
jgi:hypothetical protein